MQSEVEKVIEVVGAVIVHGGKILIVQRGATEHGAGDWEFPGGKREVGETREQALAREIDEELGLSVRIHEHLGDEPFAGSQRKYLLSLYLCSVTSTKIQLREHQDFRWVFPHELEEAGFSKPDVPFFARIKKKLYSD